MSIEVMGTADASTVNSPLSGSCKEHWVAILPVTRKPPCEINSPISSLTNRSGKQRYLQIGVKMLEEQTCFNLGKQRMSLSVLSDVKDDQFWWNWPLRKINFNQKDEKKHITNYSTLSHRHRRSQEKLPLPLSIINSVVADNGLYKYPRGISAVSRYCHRYLHQFFLQFPDEKPKILFNNDQITDLDVDICSMKCLIELFYNAFPRLLQIYREWYLKQINTSFNNTHSYIPIWSNETV